MWGPPKYKVQKQSAPVEGLFNKAADRVYKYVATAQKHTDWHANTLN